MIKGGHVHAHRQSITRNKKRVSPESWRRRVEKAHLVEMLVEEIEAHIISDMKQEDAIREVCEPSQRSRMLRSLKRYRQEGIEGLIDKRKPRDKKVSREERVVIEGMRRVNPEMGAEKIEEFVVKTLRRSPSQSTIKPVLKEAGLERPAGRPKKGKVEGVEVEALCAAGLELLKAAEARVARAGTRPGYSRARPIMPSTSSQLKRILRATADTLAS